MKENIPDYLLNTKRHTFEPPIPETELSQRSAKLVFSTRMYPEWMVAAYGVLKQRFPSLSIDSASEIFQYAVQLLIKDNIEVLGGSLPTTQMSLDFLIENGYVSADSKRQLSRLGKANLKATQYEEAVSQSSSLKDQLEYWRTRDPEKAKQIEDEAIAAAMAGLDEALTGERKPREWEMVESPADEQVIDANKRRYTQDEFSKEHSQEPEPPAAEPPVSKPLPAEVDDTDLLRYLNDVKTKPEKPGD